tara:strand:- start:5562 stop:5921 length:360 start_codon:yes stop_codon:yes gene_type:complete
MRRKSSAGVKRQYSGTAEADRQLPDRCLPWLCQCPRARCRQTYFPESVTHRPKTELTLERLLHALKSGVTARWMTGDVVYCECLRLHWPREERGQGYVMKISRKTHVWHQRKIGEAAGG